MKVLVCFLLVLLSPLKLHVHVHCIKGTVIIMQYMLQVTVLEKFLN